MIAQRAYSLLLSSSVLLFVASTARAQYKLEICEDLKITEAHYGINTVETATCVNPTKTFSPKGTLRNVNAVYSFPKVPTGAGVTFIVTKNDANGEYVRDVDYSVSPNHTTAYARFTINDPGKYYLQLVNHYNKAQVWAATDRTDTDWTVMLLDVFPDGHSERVQDGLVRARFRRGMEREVPLVPGRVERYDIDLWFTSMVFQPGHRLRVSIASALFPKYDRNLNTGGNNERDTTFVVAHQRVLHDAAHPSHVVLPVIPR